MNMQSSIKAIETVYRGYRFRSRLEARWAVFFDQLNLRWEYEHQGFELDGERYLPDFWLPELNGFVEVKPETMPPCVTPMVYMAGRMIAPTKGETSVCYRPLSVYNPEISDSDKTDIWFMRRNGYRFDYCGPYTTGTGNHCGVHGDADDHMGNEGLCFERSLSGIRAAGVVFAMFEDLEAFGTLVEVGFARGLGKRIVVGLSGAAQAWEEDPRWSEDAKAFEGEVSGVDRSHDLWFAARAAEKVFSGSRDRVLSDFFDWLERAYPMPRDQKLIRKLAAAQSATACVVYGDPIGALDTDYGGDGDGGLFEGGSRALMATLKIDYPHWRSAALAARQARFEHGQSGAR